MKTVHRSIINHILEDLQTKMVFVSGPRQVGKTTLSKDILQYREGVYLNWDNREDRKRIIGALWPQNGIVVIDELHKYRKWKQFIKGEYDKKTYDINFLITGSARLNIYRKGGDSLQGRYHLYRLHPFSIAEGEGFLKLPLPFRKIELHEDNRNISSINIMLKYGGFPEPYLNAEERFFRRWRKERFDRVIHEDVRDVSNVSDIYSIELLVDMLSSRVGSPLSLNSIREDIEVSYRAVANWITILEHLYVCYRIYPFQGKLTNSLKKEAKLYMWDWVEVEDFGARYENMIAGHLLKLCYSLEDIEGYNCRLWYIRDRNRHEVDFLVTVDGKPWFAVEAKLSETGKNHLRYFKERLEIPYAYFVSMDNKETYKKGDIVYTSAGTFLRSIGV